jgi:hypothetical protein
MPRPVSGNQLRQLGKRLARPGPVSDADYELLEQLAGFYQGVTSAVVNRLQEMGLENTTRSFKSTGTIADKLRRTHLSLGEIQDLAGTRIVIDGGRLYQDRIVARIMEAFSDCPKPPRCDDRRQKPSHGYRAVHVIVYEGGAPMEIQVRTKLQDTWAQMSEKLGDIWGRGIRYGEGPDEPDAPSLPVPRAPTRREVAGELQMFAEDIDMVETLEANEAGLRERMVRLDPANRGDVPELLRGLTEELATSKDNLHAACSGLLQYIGYLGGPQ